MNRIRLGLAAGVLGFFGAVGCDQAPPPEVATKTNPQAGLDAIKKLQGGTMPTPKGMQPASEAPKK
jgi:hypothetical protein